MKKIIILFILICFYACSSHNTKYTKQDLVDESFKALKNQDYELIRTFFGNKDYVMSYFYPSLSFNDLNGEEKREINRIEKEIRNLYEESINEIKFSHFIFYINWDKFKYIIFSYY